MKTRTLRLLLILTLLAAMVLILPLAAGCGESKTEETEKVSAPGEYSGYSEPLYTGYETESHYVDSFDGTKIAVDAFVPTGGPDNQFPAILIMTPYHRASVDGDEVMDYMSDPDSPYRTLSSYGYAIVVADVRGTGASYGTRYALFFPEEVKDGDSVVNWIADQSWSDGNVGMMGQSYLATMQFMNAANQNPHLKCIIPRYSFLDIYDFVYPGGIFNFKFVDRYDLAMELLNTNVSMPSFDVYPSKPVDEDTNGSMLAEATLEHEGNLVMKDEALKTPYRDSTMELEGQTLTYDIISPSGHLQEIEDSGVAIYNMGGWMDCYVTATLSFQDTLSNTSKCLVGDYDHTQGFDGYTMECLRFFDHYLKGIDNGIDEEEPFYIYTSGADEWNFYDQWPLDDQVMTPYYFAAGGELSTTKPAEGTDEYTVDYTTSSGENTRWLAMTGEPSEYIDRTEMDEKCLNYTTVALDSDVEVTGHPEVHLFVSSTATDGDFFVYLEDIDDSGFAAYKTEGELRASLRKVGTRPWLPDIVYQPSGQADVQELVPGEMVELVFDMYAISHLFKEGHKIRVSIACADDTNFITPVLDPPPTITMYTGGDSASYINLPVIEK
ncbi:MAG: CocE/NonD family hydrolase [Actinomycetota bacterium]|nr:CocE/NonD family hydrolase [Actinomycetota bacterium]